MPSAFGVSQSFWQNAVLDRDVSDPSTLAPANGDRFIVGLSAIGVWSGHDNEIAEFNAAFSVWSFFSPVEGWVVYIVDEDIYVRYTGIVWVIIGSAALNLIVQELGINIASAVDTINFTGGMTVIDNGSGKVTIDIAGNQNLFETVTADTGSTTANLATDTLNVVGGTDIMTSILGDTLTITNANPNVDQNLFETVAADSGSTTADITTDTLTIAGGSNVTTAIVGDTLTISASAGAADQNLWETITADSGSTTANITTDTLIIAGTTSEIVTSIVSDTISIGVADNAILPGTASLTVPIGTTAQRPGTPIAGMMRYNSTLDCIEIYDGAWSCLRKQDEAVGAVFVLPFSTDGNLQNSWLDFTGNNILTNATPSVMAFQSKLIALTFSNDSPTVGLDFEIYRTPETVEPTVTQDLLFTWSITNSRTGRRTNFATDIIFNAGDKIGVFARKTGSAGSNVIITMFMQVLGSNNEEIFDTTANDMSA